MKVLISTSSFGECDSGPLEMLRAKGHEIALNPYKRTLTEAELVELAKGCEGILAGTERYSEEVFEKLPELRAISRCGAGMDAVDMEAAKRHDVLVKNTPNAPTEAVAELALCLMLDVLRRVSKMDRKIRKGEWKKENGHLLSGKTVGIVGLGRIGRRVAELLQPFKVNILGADVKPDAEWARAHSVRLCEMDELLAKSDIVTLHAAYTQESKGIINAKRIGTMKKGAILINTARGGLVDEDALFSALQKGAIGGAGLDVMGQEPYGGPLRELESVVLTPHIGAYAKEARIAMETEAAENLLQLLSRGKT